MTRLGPKAITLSRPGPRQGQRGSAAGRWKARLLVVAAGLVLALMPRALASHRPSDEVVLLVCGFWIVLAWGAGRLGRRRPSLFRRPAAVVGGYFAGALAGMAFYWVGCTFASDGCPSWPTEGPVSLSHSRGVMAGKPFAWSESGRLGCRTRYGRRP